MIKSFIDTYKNLDEKILHILKNGLFYSFMICIFSSIILLLYLFHYSIPSMYYTGILGIAIGLNSAVGSLISAVIVDNVKKESI